MRLNLISDFNIDLLAGYLKGSAEVPGLDVIVGPYNQVPQVISEMLAERTSDDGVFLWVRPESVILSFARAIEMKSYSVEEVLREVDAFCDIILELSTKRRACFFASWGAPVGNRGYGILDWRPGLGISHIIAAMNLRLAERLSVRDNIFLMNSDRWYLGLQSPLSPKMWYAAKIPFHADVFKAAGRELARAILAVKGMSRRLVILDLDGTLWGGVVGEVGWRGLRLGGHDYVGEAYEAFQKALKALTKMGIQIAIVSKNDESVALEAIERHAGMVLRMKDFAGWRINWRDKASNVLELLDELRLGASSAVFIDDNPAERERVRSALPQILVPEWPQDPSQYAVALGALGCFDVPVLSDEDRLRTAMYTNDRERRETLKGATSLEDWMRQLGMVVVVEPLSAGNLPRIGQLFNKTNQLNLSTRRLSNDEIQKWSSEPGRVIFAISVSDKFGNMGLSGVLGLSMERDQCVIVDFILSCRAMGRHIERLMFHVASEWGRAHGAAVITAQYLKTDRNRPTLEVFESLGLGHSDEHTFTWWLDRPYPKPTTIRVDGFVAMSDNA